MQTTLEKGEDLVIKHFGVKGMKWGVRKDQSQTQRSPEAEAASKSLQKAKTHGSTSLTNKEMQDLVNRLNLEQQYSRLTDNPGVMKRGANWSAKFAGEIAKDLTKSTIKAAGNYYIGEALGDYIGKPSKKKNDD